MIPMMNRSMPSLAYQVAFDLVGSLALGDAKQVGLIASSAFCVGEILYRLQPDQKLYLMSTDHLHADPTRDMVGTSPQVVWLDRMDALPQPSILLWIEPELPVKPM